MSLMIDLNSLGDLIAAEGTEGDQRAWARVRAELDRREALSWVATEEAAYLSAELDRLRAELAAASEGRSDG